MFLALVASCDQPSAPVTSQLDVAEVVAGTGDISPDVVERIRTLVATELVSLQAAFDGEQVERFSVHVHGSRDSMPAHLVAGLHRDSPGFAILGRHQIHLIWGEMIRLAAKPAAVVRHELVHELLDALLEGCLAIPRQHLAAVEHGAAILFEVVVAVVAVWREFEFAEWRGVFQKFDSELFAIQIFYEIEKPCFFYIWMLPIFI